MKIDCEDDVVLVRRRIRALAQEGGFDPFATAAVTTAASELARNVLVHAHKGDAQLEVLLDENGRHGLRLTVRDQGPGIAALDRALAGGYSSAASLGLGLSGSRRLCDIFEIKTAVGQGTTITATKWARF